MAVIDILAVHQTAQASGSREEGKASSSWGVWKALGLQTAAGSKMEAPSPSFQACLEKPVPGTGQDFPCFQVKGWAYSPEVPVEAVLLECEGRKLQRLKVGLPRTDVAVLRDAKDARFCGFNGLVGVLGLPPETKVEVVAIRKDRTRLPVATIQLRHNPMRAAFGGKLQPLMVQALGRSGTTWLMRLLGEHPAIAVAGGYPYEVRYAQCWLGLVQVVSNRTNLALSEGILNQHFWGLADKRVYDNPWLAAEQLDLGQGFLQKIVGRAQAQVDAFYQQQVQAKGKSGPAYFAEKMVGQAAIGLSAFYPGYRDLFLVRDFRDVFCSVLSFNDKRHFLDFGRQLATSDEDYIRLLAGSARRLLDQHQQRRHQTYLLRYEDLILQPEATLRQLLQSLQLDARPEVVAAMLKRARQDSQEMTDHRTSGSPEQSVGRWRTQMPATYRKQFQDLMGDLLQAFGYEADDLGRKVA